MSLKRYAKKIAAVAKTPVALAAATVSGDKQGVKAALQQTVSTPLNQVKAGTGDKLVSAGSKTVSAVRTLSTAVSAPITNFQRDAGNWNDPRALLRGTIHDGLAIGRAAEATVVTLNPLDSTLEKFDMQGKKAGGLGHFLGVAVGERFREKPIAGATLVYGAVAAAGSTVVKEAASQAVTWVASGGVKAAAGYVTTAGSVVKTATSMLNKPGAKQPQDGGQQLGPPQAGQVNPLVLGAGALLVKLLLF